MKIAILDDYAAVAKDVGGFDRIEGAVVSVFKDTITDQAALVDRLGDFDVICLMRERTPFPATLIEQLPKLKLLVTSGPRNLSIDLQAASAQGVVVCGTESRKTTTSEFAMLLILASSRELISEHQSMQQSGWQSGLGRDLNGLSLGLIGLGKIGSQMAKLGQAFGMTVNAWSTNLKAEACEAQNVTWQPDLKSLMAASDVVSIHLVLSDRSRGLVDATALSAMRERAILVNTSRGPIVNQDDLLKGMKQGKPWKAALDVYDVEPLPADSGLRDGELVSSGRMLLSPHLGYVTEQTWSIFYTQTVDAIMAWQQDRPIRVLNG